jgi:hypothetical protein
MHTAACCLDCSSFNFFFCQNWLFCQVLTNCTYRDKFAR